MLAQKTWKTVQVFEAVRRADCRNILPLADIVCVHYISFHNDAVQNKLRDLSVYQFTVFPRVNVNLNHQFNQQLSVRVLSAYDNALNCYTWEHWSPCELPVEFFIYYFCNWLLTQTSCLIISSFLKQHLYNCKMHFQILETTFSIKFCSLDGQCEFRGVHPIVPWVFVPCIAISTWIPSFHNWKTSGSNNTEIIFSTHWKHMTLNNTKFFLSGENKLDSFFHHQHLSHVKLEHGP